MKGLGGLSLSLDPGLIRRIKKTDLQYNTRVNVHTVNNMSLVLLKNSGNETADGVRGHQPRGCEWFNPIRQHFVSQLSL